MELINISRELLLRPLQIVSGIVERRHTLPILANLLIHKKGGKVSFTSTDIEMQITTFSDFAKGEGEVTTTVAARKLVDILRAMPEGEVSLALSDKRMTVRSGKSHFSLQVLSAEEFPIVKETQNLNTHFTLTQKTLKNLLAMTYFSMAHQDIRYYLNGMLFVFDEKKITAVATDGHRLAYNSINNIDTDNTVRHEIIVPRKTIIELQRLLEDSSDPIDISFSSTQIKFKFGQIEVISKLVEGKFPDYKRVIPTAHKNTFLLDRNVLQSALQRAAILTSEKFKGVRCVISDNLLKVNSSNKDQEEAREEIEIVYQGDPIDIGFNVTYLLDVLSNLKQDEIQLSFNDSNSSALVMIPNDDSFKYVVMPMRI
ncbi:MAG: DNA polymerase III subunit beta [Ottowia sp.]|nr:DNA polymerase III subunit beta [Ottowia sp.]